MITGMALIDDAAGYSVEEIRELAKNENVFCMYNTYEYETKLFENAGHPERGPESCDRCWRVKPLNFLVNDKKDDTRVEVFLLGILRGHYNVFRMETA